MKVERNIIFLAKLLAINVQNQNINTGRVQVKKIASTELDEVVLMNASFELEPINRLLSLQLHNQRCM
jgi:hypothetical protein